MPQRYNESYNEYMARVTTLEYIEAQKSEYMNILTANAPHFTAPEREEIGTTISKIDNRFGDNHDYLDMIISRAIFNGLCRALRKTYRQGHKSTTKGAAQSQYFHKGDEIIRVSNHNIWDNGHRRNWDYEFVITAQDLIPEILNEIKDI